jgi:hypothetical protein
LPEVIGFGNGGGPPNEQFGTSIGGDGGAGGTDGALGGNALPNGTPGTPGTNEP